MLLQQAVYLTKVQFYDSTVLGSDRRSVNKRQNWLVQIGDLVQISDLNLTLTLSLTLPDLNLSIFPSIPCLVSGRRSEPIIILYDNCKMDLVN